MGQQRFKALVLKKLKEVFPGHLSSELKILEYNEGPDAIRFVLHRPGPITLTMLEAFAELFQSRDIIVSLDDAWEIERSHYGKVWSTRVKKCTIIIKNPCLTNIFRSKRIPPDHRFDLDIDDG